MIWRKGENKNFTETLDEKNNYLGIKAIISFTKFILVSNWKFFFQSFSRAWFHGHFLSNVSFKTFVTELIKFYSFLNI